MKKLLLAAIRIGLRQGFKRGIQDGQRVWVYVGAVALVGHLAGRYGGKGEAEVIFSEQLKPGEVLRITNRLPDGKEKYKG